VASSRLVATRRRHGSDGLGALRHMLKRATSLASLTVISSGLVCRGPDLTVTAKGAPVKASFAGDQAMVMGDLVPLDREVPAVMACLFRGGLEVLAL
jgi:hypothetical protein